MADDGELYHLFFLQAPALPGHPGLRHLNATVGHATSTDLVHWDYLGECFGPAESGWDDLAIWTGSVVRDGGHWRMFYTAVNSEGHGVYDQRVGSAISTDLHHWTRVGHQPARPSRPALVQDPGPHAAAGALPRPAGGPERDLAGPAGHPRPGRQRLAPADHRPLRLRRPQRRRGDRPRLRARPGPAHHGAAAVRAGPGLRPAGGAAEQDHRRPRRCWSSPATRRR